jgi:hypothetical protein
MPNLDDDLSAHLKQFQDLYDQDLLSEANFRTALRGLGVSPDQIQRYVECQIIVQGDYIEQRNEHVLTALCRQPIAPLPDRPTHPDNLAASASVQCAPVPIGPLPDRVVGLIAITAQLQATDAWARLINMPAMLRMCQADQQKAKVGGAPL